MICFLLKQCYFKRALYTRRAGRVVEGAALEMRCTARYRGFESLALRHFFCKKNGERRRKSSLHCAKHNFTSSRGASRSSLNHRYALLVKTLHFIPLVKRSACAAREVAACRRMDVFLYTALRLHGGKPP